MQIPRWLSRQLDEKGLERIRASVTAGERGTSGEIVPMIVHGSAHTGHVPWIVFLASIAVLSAMALYVPAPLWIVEIGVVVVSVLLACLLPRFDFIRRICVPANDREAAALMRAQLEFYELNLSQTTGRTGILIFVSLREHQAVVLADEAIAKQLPEETWTGVIDLLLEGVRRGDFAGGMTAAVDLCGKLLADKFPRAADDRDELPNRLIIEE